MAVQSQCRHCGAALPNGANFCLDCGAPVGLVVLDPVGFDEPPLPVDPNMPGRRGALFAVLALVVGMVVVLWTVARDIDSPSDEPLSSETPEAAIVAADPTTSTAMAATTTPTTRAAPTTTTEQQFVNGIPGPVLGDEVDDVLVQVGSRTLRLIDLASGAIEHIDLDHPVYADGPESGIVVSGTLFTARERRVTITDLSDGSQPEVGSFADRTFGLHVAGAASVDSIWLATYAGPDINGEAIEIDTKGEVRRFVEIPQPFSIRWANGDELILDGIDGSWRYDTITEVAERMPGTVVAFAPGFVVMASCDESLECDVLVDRGAGPEAVDWLAASELFNGSISLAPDLTGALLHIYGEHGIEYTYIDLDTGSRLDLGELGIEPYPGVVWVEDSWMVARNESSRTDLLAIDTETGGSVDIGLGRIVGPQSFLTVIPSE